MVLRGPAAAARLWSAAHASRFAPASTLPPAVRSPHSSKSAEEQAGFSQLLTPSSCGHSQMQAPAAGERQWLPLESNPDVVTAFSHRMGASSLWKVPAPPGAERLGRPLRLLTRCRACGTVPRRLRHRPGAAGLCADPRPRGAACRAPPSPLLALLQATRLIPTVDSRAERTRLRRLLAHCAGCDRRSSSSSRSRPSPSRRQQVLSRCRCCAPRAAPPCGVDQH